MSRRRAGFCFPNSCNIGCDHTISIRTSTVSQAAFILSFVFVEKYVVKMNLFKRLILELHKSTIPVESGGWLGPLSLELETAMQ